MQTRYTYDRYDEQTKSIIDTVKLTSYEAMRLNEAFKGQGSKSKFIEKTKTEKAMEKELASISKASKKEGWDIFFNGYDASGTHNVFELQRLDEARIFKNDNGAIRSVIETAIEKPRSIHARAVKFLTKHSPNEIDSIFRTAVGKKKFEKLMTVLKIKL